MIASCTDVLFRLALRSGGLDPGIGLADFVESIPPVVDTHTPELSKTWLISSKIYSASFIFLILISSIVFSILSDACANQLEFWARTEDWDWRIFALVGYGEAPADCAGECANTGDKLGMGVGCACVFVDGSIVAVPELWLESMLCGWLGAGGP